LDYSLQKLLSCAAPVLSRFGPRPGPVPFCQAFVRCCQATYCLCPPFCRHYLTTAKKILFTHPLSAQGACPVCTGPRSQKEKNPKNRISSDFSLFRFSRFMSCILCSERFLIFWCIRQSAGARRERSRHRAGHGRADRPAMAVDAGLLAA